MEMVLLRGSLLADRRSAPQHGRPVAGQNERSVPASKFLVALTAAGKPVEPPDFASRVRAAQQAIEQAITRSGLKGDPYGEILEVLGLALGVVAEIPEQVDVAREPLDPQAMRLLVDRVAKAGTAAMERRADSLARAVSVRSAVIRSATAAALLLGGVAAGWFARTWSDPPASVTGCVLAPQTQGGVAYTCTFWIKPPGPR